MTWQSTRTQNHASRRNASIAKLSPKDSNLRFFLRESLDEESIDITYDDNNAKFSNAAIVYTKVLSTIVKRNDIRTHRENIKIQIDR